MLQLAGARAHVTHEDLAARPHRQLGIAPSVIGGTISLEAVRHAVLHVHFEAARSGLLLSLRSLLAARTARIATCTAARAAARMAALSIPSARSVVPPDARVQLCAHEHPQVSQLEELVTVRRRHRHRYRPRPFSHSATRAIEAILIRQLRPQSSTVEQLVLAPCRDHGRDERLVDEHRAHLAISRGRAYA